MRRKLSDREAPPYVLYPSLRIAVGRFRKAGLWGLEAKGIDMTLPSLQVELPGKVSEMSVKDFINMRRQSLSFSVGRA